MIARSSLSAVVVVVPQHSHFIPRLVENLNDSLPPFDEIVIVASGFNWAERKTISHSVKKLNYQFQLVFPDLGSAGRNRNIGRKLSSSDLVSFLDADDIYAPDRNSIIHEVFASTNFDIFLHSFVEFFDDRQLMGQFSAAKELNLQDLIDEREIFHLTFPMGFRDRKQEISGNAPSTNLLLPERLAAHPVHHAHVVAHRRIFSQLEFHEIFGVRNEDGVFARDVLEQGGHVVVAPLTLSGYQQGARAKPKQRNKLSDRWRHFFARLAS